MKAVTKEYRHFEVGGSVQRGKGREREGRKRNGEGDETHSRGGMKPKKKTEQCSEFRCMIGRRERRVGQ